MGEFADRMGTKDPGNLILSGDWNEVVSEVDKINGDVAGVAATVAENKTLIDTLDTRISDALTTLATLESTIQTLRQQFRRLRLNTARANFAIGEQGEIIAQVTDLEGNALSFADAASRPWVDFVTVWGQFRAASGFLSRGGEDDRSISVRCDANGIARVTLSADHTGAVSTQASEEVAAVMETRSSSPSSPSPSGTRLGDRILAANTPMEANLDGAFQVFNLEYERSDSQNFRNYVDQYYLASPYYALPGYRYRHSWRDHRTTVMAFVKADNDPLTADLNLASSSIQVSFRDWIGPWINLGYLADLGILEGAVRTQLAPRVENDYRRTSEGWLDEIGGLMANRGVIGRQKVALAAEQALANLNVTNPPPFMQEVTQTFRQAMRFQQSLNYSQNLALENNSAPVGLNLVGNLDGKAQSDNQRAKADLQLFVDEQIDQARNSLNNEIRAVQQQFRDDLFAESGTIRNLQRDVTSINGIVTNLQDFNVGDAQTRLNLVEGLNIRMQALEGRSRG